MTERFGATLSTDDCRERLAGRIQRWPLFGYRWTQRRGLGGRIDARGFVVRGMPRISGTPLIEAVGRWRSDGGADVTYRPALMAYLPSVLLNSFVLTLFWVGVVAIGAGAGLPSTVWLLASYAGLYMFVFILVLQILVGAWLLLRHRTRDREQLRVLLREAFAA